MPSVPEDCCRGPALGLPCRMRGRAGRCEGERAIVGPADPAGTHRPTWLRSRGAMASGVWGAPACPCLPSHTNWQSPRWPSARQGAARRDTLLSPSTSGLEVFCFLLDMAHVDSERLESLPSQRWAFSSTLSSDDSAGEAGHE